MARMLCGFAALCSVWIHTAAAVVRGGRSAPWAWQPGNEVGSGPYGSDGVPEPRGDVVAPVEGDIPEDREGDYLEPRSDAGRPRLGKGAPKKDPEWEQLMPKFTGEQQSVLTANTRGEDNLCLHGQLVPELLVIGAMASATVSFSLSLAYSPALLWPNRTDLWPSERGNSDGWKFGQGHFFDVMYKKGRSSLNLAYGPCDRGKRMVAVDSTSRYALDPLVPMDIASWYGVNMGQHLKLVYILRDPLERLHSHYWKAVKGRWCRTLPKAGFNKFIARLLSGQDGWYVPTGSVTDVAKGTAPRCTEILGASMYVPHFTTWFRTFDTRQFVIIPFKFITTGDSLRSVPAEAVWRWLGVNGLTPPRLHMNAEAEAYPKLHEELSPEQEKRFWKRYKKYMSGEAVAEKLANTNARLYGFQANRTSAEVARWLVNSW